MKSKRTLWVVVGVVLIFLVCVAVYAVYTRTVYPMQDATGLELSSFSVGTGEDAASCSDVEELERVLRAASGNRSLSGSTSYTVTDDTILIDGQDDEGAVHLVLQPDCCFYYRNGNDKILLKQPETLYAAVSALLAE